MQMAPEIHIALLHYPVINKSGEIIGSAITNLDLHDIARAARTYGISTFFVVSPYRDQHELVSEIVDHWLNGHGSRANPARKEALGLIKMADNLDQVTTTIAHESGVQPFLIATSANRHENEISYDQARGRLAEKNAPLLLLFGTAHGMSGVTLQKADAVLAPIYGTTNYNHLSVRSAVSIILDRLLGR